MEVTAYQKGRLANNAISIIPTSWYSHILEMEYCEYTATKVTPISLNILDIDVIASANNTSGKDTVLDGKNTSLTRRKNEPRIS